MDREQSLISWLRERSRIAIGYSGGVDSAYLAAVAVAALGAENVLAIIGRSASYPDSQWKNARDVAAGIGLVVDEVDTDELNDPRYAANPTNRCYFCKTELWSQLAPVARARGFEVVADGTNADDLHDWRPGAQAAREHGIASPLADLGFSKSSRPSKPPKRRFGMPVSAGISAFGISAISLGWSCRAASSLAGRRRKTPRKSKLPCLAPAMLVSRSILAGSAPVDSMCWPTFRAPDQNPGACGSFSRSTSLTTSVSKSSPRRRRFGRACPRSVGFAIRTFT
jgi:hypothetical protein